MWEKIKEFFKHSETIFIARLQVIGGLVLIALTVVDPHLFTAYIPEKYVPLWLIFSGIITEIARRRRAPDLE